MSTPKPGETSRDQSFTFAQRIDKPVEENYDPYEQGLLGSMLEIMDVFSGKRRVIYEISFDGEMLAGAIFAQQAKRYFPNSRRTRCSPSRFLCKLTLASCLVK